MQLQVSSVQVARVARVTRRRADVKQLLARGERERAAARRVIMEAGSRAGPWVATHVEAVHARQHAARAAPLPRDAVQREVRRERAVSARLELRAAAHLSGDVRSRVQRDAKRQRCRHDDD